MERLTEQRIGELEVMYAKAVDRCEATAEEIGSVWSAFPAIAAEARKGLQQRWIPVSERLPEQGVRVLLSRGAVIIVGHYCGLSKNWSDGGSYALRAPTHWQPLPEPPQALTDGGTGG